MSRARTVDSERGRKPKKTLAQRKRNHMQIVRQGDVPVVPVSAIPGSAKPIARDNGRIILAYGEVTGHAHALHGPGATLLAGDDGARYLAIAGEAHTTLRPVALLDPLDTDTIRVEDASGLILRLGRAAYEERVLKALGATLTLPGEVLQHEEHDAIVLAPGNYRLPGQREYTSKDMAPRRVAD
jgi:hypothetical protein